MKSSFLGLLAGAAEKLTTFLENRDQKQKNQIVVFLFALVLVVDFFVLVRPVLYVFSHTMPELASQKAVLKGLEDDMKNRQVIDKNWAASRVDLAAAESQFIPQTEISSLLEKLSKLAQSSQVKIITLKPMETVDAGSGFLKIPIRMSAVAATHDLGHFLAQLEGGPICFKVLDLRISANSSDEHRHVVELSIETYAKTK